MYFHNSKLTERLKIWIVLLRIPIRRADDQFFDFMIDRFLALLGIANTFGIFSSSKVMERSYSYVAIEMH